MATTYKTPGVYIEEIPKFPPSIAPVETAIPAFIGYTEKALNKGESLTNKPTKIESIAEYVELFGEGPSQEIEVYLDSDNNYVGCGQSGTGGRLLYDSLRMFYANGGGNCYIVSIGSYDDSLDKQDFLDGLEAVESEDEPTILLFPDAVNLSGNELHDVQVAALSQCNKLQDRVTVCDTVKSDDFGDDVQQLRDNIGINNLKYGAAYGPWINTSLPRYFYFRDLTLKRGDTAGDVIEAASLTSDTAILQMLSDVTEAQEAVDELKDAETAIAGEGKSWSDKLKEMTDAYNSSAATTLAALEAPLQGIYDLLADIVAEVSDMIDGLPTVVTASPDPSVPETKDFILKKDITQYLGSSKLKSSVFDVLAANYNYVLANGTINLFSDDPATATTDLGKAIALLGYTDSAAFLAVTNAEVTAKYTVSGITEKQQADVAKNAAIQAASSIIALFRFAQNSAAEYEKKFNDALLGAFGTYKNLVSKAIESLNQLPPSGAIAGVYAAVDSDRGVWKAPANVSLNSVISPAAKISQEQQADYNVDANAGKSINIIRSFTGKGVLVWGARTLAGNDNEWRYVNVRRFFNFVEESVKKATEQFVFEPNDANTWVRIQAMIENFLTVLWRQGALQGIKPEHAFYVAVGLGKTMTALDILEGRMIIEIGMAAVRPAEFIILRFSHKMAES
ncbi:putative phage tail sheath protein FI [Chlorobaculum parvum NCIB 8327]|uniref:Phage tail sheath protein FI n=1 Tax=Chlorobaculum parvum (strain DSM 263 / NCIMB 8327) TaxID=517417 RepID=B3QN11_CHLP8|nr:phage tail sheath C-terminal domain-containing protein [Chlorobaculum parvum]ACF11314.1 putative phage tail sheath protein FI [Chlorobaculum parvum NCIB 8327]